MIEIKPLKRVIKREWQKIISRWSLLFATIIGPLLSFFLIVWIFSQNVPRDLPVAFVDMDHSQLSRQMARMVDATSIASINRSFISLDNAHKAMDEGEIDAIVYVQKGLEKDVLHGGNSKIALYLNNVNVVKSGLLNSGIRKALGTLSAGIKLQVQLKSGQNQAQAMARIMPVQLNSELLFNPYTSYSYYLTIGLMPIILIVFTLLGTIYSIGDELYRGTGPKWLQCADDNFATALLGKLLPYTIFYFCIAQIMNLILFNYLGVPIRGDYHIIIVSELFLIISYQFMAIFLVSLTTNMRLSMSLGSAYSMLALTYSGLTFPAMGMPAIGQAFSYIFPYTYWIKILIGQSLRGEPINYGVLPMLSLFLFILLGLMFVPRLRYMMFNKKRWGKI